MGYKSDALSPRLRIEEESPVHGLMQWKKRRAASVTRGRVWHKDGYLLFRRIPANKIMKWAPDGQVTTFREDSGGADG